MERSRKVHQRVSTLSRGQKRLIMVMADLLVLPIALWSAYALRLSEWWPSRYMEPFWWLFLVLPVAGVFVFARLGLYRAVVRFMGTQAIIAVAKGVVILALLLWSAAFFFQLNGFPRSVPINFALVAFVYVGGTRLLVRSYYQWLIKHYTDKEPVIIYGAGGAAVQLNTALAGGREFFNVAFVDDDRNLWGSTIRGVKVYPPSELGVLIERFKAARLLLAIPSATKQERKRVLDLTEPHPIHVQTVPSMAEIVSGTAAVDQLREIDLEDLLGRDPVPPRPGLFSACIKGKVVLVTGAGGSIGSELCRQILMTKPRALLLYEMSEFALYSIERELALECEKQGWKVPIYPILGSVCNEARVRDVVLHYGVQTVYHAAAYKHVPLVEHNIFEGIRNNIIGTRVVATVAAELGVERCVLISTDKAVRPTNVMGVTKRFAELVLQELAERGGKTIFSMVRFGNVLGSSGSVVPLFRQQIAAGGPLTVTHPEITRFFMTIPEAAQLVIQAGAMAEGGDVFVLDMGEPVKIVELARRMLHLSGLELKSEQNPEGDIEIAFTGLRPGEKLYEELLIGDNVVGTEHPKILRALEEKLGREELADYLGQLKEAENTNDFKKARQILEVAVKGYLPSSPIVDWLDVKQAPKMVVTDEVKLH